MGVSGAYSPANITAGQSSQLLYASADATVLGIVCNGLWGTAVSSPDSLYLNQPWYFNPQTWPDPGVQTCNIHAHNSLGEVAYVEVTLVVAPAGFAASGGGTSGMAIYDPSNPNAPVPTGSSANSGRPLGYIDANGNIFSDPAGTIPCGNCNTSSGATVNVNRSDPSYDPPYTGGGDGE